MSADPRMADVVTALQAIAASWGIKMSADLSAYSVMILAAVGGAIWALIQQQGKADTARNRFAAAWFVVGRVGLVVLIGAMIVNIMSSTFGIDTRNIVGPVGGFVAAVGGGWFVDLAKGIIARRVGDKQP